MPSKFCGSVSRHSANYFLLKIMSIQKVWTVRFLWNMQMFCLLILLNDSFFGGIRRRTGHYTITSLLLRFSSRSIHIFYAAWASLKLPTRCLILCGSGIPTPLNNSSLCHFHCCQQMISILLYQWMPSLAPYPSSARGIVNLLEWERKTDFLSLWEPNTPINPSKYCRPW